MTYRNVHYLLTEKHASLLHCDQFLEYTHAQGEKKEQKIHFFANTFLCTFLYFSKFNNEHVLSVQEK